MFNPRLALVIFALATFAAPARSEAAEPRKSKAEAAAEKAVKRRAQKVAKPPAPRARKARAAKQTRAARSAPVVGTVEAAHFSLETLNVTRGASASIQLEEITGLGEVRAVTAACSPGMMVADPSPSTTISAFLGPKYGVNRNGGPPPINFRRRIDVSASMEAALGRATRLQGRSGDGPWSYLPVCIRVVEAPVDPSAAPNLESQPLPFERFRCDRSDHRLLNSYLLAFASARIYDEPGESWSAFRTRYRSEMQEAGAGRVRFFRSTSKFSGTSGTEGAVLELDGCTAVVFRGSEAPVDQPGGLDWGTDLGAAPWPTPISKVPSWWKNGVFVHFGFWKAMRSVYTDFAKGITDFRKSENEAVFLAGHSLGGALATTAAYALERYGDANVKAVYTYGQPKVGEEDFRADYDAAVGHDHHFRWAFGADPVSLLPPGAGELGYRHVGELQEAGPGVLHNLWHYGKRLWETMSQSQREGMPTEWWESFY